MVFALQFCLTVEPSPSLLPSSTTLYCDHTNSFMIPQTSHVLVHVHAPTTFYWLCPQCTFSVLCLAKSGHSSRYTESSIEPPFGALCLLLWAPTVFSAGVYRSPSEVIDFSVCLCHDDKALSCPRHPVLSTMPGPKRHAIHCWII